MYLFSPNLRILALSANMPWLRMLLACNLLALGLTYDYGYHRRPEQLDQFVRTGPYTWTRAHDGHSAGRRRAWTERPTGLYVPRFQYNNVRRRVSPISGGNSWPGHVESLDQNHPDQQTASTNVLAGHEISSSLDFRLFSDEATQDPQLTQTLPLPLPNLSTASTPSDGDSVFSSGLNTTEVAEVEATTLSSSATQTVSTIVEVVSGADEMQDKNSLLNRTGEQQFPLFFTNPATGIVYAITEVGKMPSLSPPNDTIPIYISKQQYDRDIHLLNKFYESKCKAFAQKQPLTTTPSSPSTPQVALKLSSSTSRPPIPIPRPRPRPTTTPKPILTSGPKPFSSNHKRLGSTAPTPLNKLATTIAPSVHQRPVRKRKKKRKKPKKKKSPRPMAAILTTQSTAPFFIWGARPNVSLSSPSKGSHTQLERPISVFNDRPAASPISAKALALAEHRRLKRSADMLTAHNSTTAPAVLAKTPAPTYAGGVGSVLRKRPARRTLPHSAQRLTQRTKVQPAQNQTGAASEFSVSVPTGAPKAALNLSQTQPAVPRMNLTMPSQGRGHKKRKGSKGNSHKGDDDFSLFDLIDDEDDNGRDESDDYDDDEDSDEYDDFYDKSEEEAPHRKRIKKPTKLAAHPPTKRPEEWTSVSVEAGDSVKDDSAITNSSSAEEEADFGAMEEDGQTAMAIDHEEWHSHSKHPFTSPPIRRRPSDISGSGSVYVSASQEDDDEDEDDMSGIGGFFRMIFYPVQMVMGRIFGTFGSDASGEDEDDDDGNIPRPPATYTLYNNVLHNQAIDKNDVEQPNTFGSWLSSWFGFNRRTKNIGSTTATPHVTAEPMPQNEIEPSWLETLFGFGAANDNADDNSNAHTDDESDNDDYSKWFTSWFGSRPKAGRTTTTTTTMTPAYSPIPILTVVDPMRNPQNWIGILAHHMSNSTLNPQLNAIAHATPTPADSPDVPHRVSYDKYQIWRLRPLNEAQVKALLELRKGEDGARVQWLRGPSLRGLTDVLVPPKMLIDFQGTLDFEGIAHEVMIFDVGKAIAYEKAKERFYHTTSSTTKRPKKHQRRPASQSRPSSTMTWHKYHNFEEIIQYLEAMRIRHPHIVELLHIGRSYEGRPLVVVKIESRESAAATSIPLGAGHKKLKHKKRTGQANAVFIEAGTHGLEWIGPATATWTINELLRIMKSNKTNADYDYIKDTTWYILPILNPDGYVYSHEYDRFWKKSRSRHISRPTGLIDSAMTWLQQKPHTEKVCYGVDLDRNWPYQWGKRGSSKTPCHELYAGPQAFSEPETKALSEFLMDNRKQIKLYVSMQSYGQIISFPLRSNVSFNAERIDDFLDVAMAGTDGLRQKGSKSRYKIDSANDLLEQRTGCSDAFAAYEVGIPFSYTLQLADNGVHGYLLPSSAIESTARDAFEIVTAMLDYI